MNILLVCGSGASTSMLAESMMKALPDDKKDNFNIQADTFQNFSNIFKKFDVVLLGPHIRYKKAELEKEAAKYDIPVDVIDGTDYALQKGEKVLKQALKLYEKAHKKS